MYTSGMLSSRLLFALCLAFFLCTVSSASAAFPSQGLVMTNWSNQYSSQNATNQLKAMRAAGIKTVVIVPTWYMRTPQSNTISPRKGKSPSTQSIRAVMGRARSLGMRIVLKPHVDVNNDSWRGDIQPSSHKAWWNSYRKFIDLYANVANSGRASRFIVGTELKTMSDETASMKTVIHSVRSHYKGNITYAANWDEFQNVHFWGSLDAIGINAYFPVGGSSVGEIMGKWGAWMGKVNAVRQQDNKPLIFTEIGYQAKHGSTSNPSYVDGKYDPAEQSRGYKTAICVWRDSPMAEMWWWHWPVNRSDDSYNKFSPQGRPALQILSAAARNTLNC